ncbi:hypothetical protein Bacsa_1374 [Phocaeicola salanitronis DSM 18170]|uniref:Uncharacterized protein n=1 Tax=Phocaeicola salanitronis (strain DSM 18170 / JCM 13657 / CCUG 60908 / BL78) TaxID=667015 RepID=F0R804_PHOSB|nr:hypothetical protein Bacsa_1374 [Phocaeicola salanitronis DSM 18170]
MQASSGGAAQLYATRPAYSWNGLCIYIRFSYVWFMRCDNCDNCDNVTITFFENKRDVLKKSISIYYILYIFIYNI